MWADGGQNHRLKGEGDETSFRETGGKLESVVFCRPSEGMLQGRRD